MILCFHVLELVVYKHIQWGELAVILCFRVLELMFAVGQSIGWSAGSWAFFYDTDLRCPLQCFQTMELR